VAIDTGPSQSISPAASDQGRDYHLIPFSKIQNFQILSLAGSGEARNSIIGPVDMQRLEAKEKTKIKKMKEDDRDRGQGVTTEGQAIFDSFKRMYVWATLNQFWFMELTEGSNLPVRWHNKEIVVHDSVIIKPPYNVEDCKGPANKQDVLIRVKKVLEGERKKLKEKEDRDRKVAIAVEPRKGG
jgi:protein LSM12